MKDYNGFADNFDFSPLAAFASSSGVSNAISEFVNVGLNLFLGQFHCGEKIINIKYQSYPINPILLPELP